MNAKQLLVKNEPLSKWWSSIVGDSRFDQVMLILKADSFEGSPSPEQLSGITQFIASMSSIINAEEPPTLYARPGLNYETDTPKKK
jgi:hypothetical protein